MPLTKCIAAICRRAGYDSLSFGFGSYDSWWVSTGWSRQKKGYLKRNSSIGSTRNSGPDDLSLTSC